MPTHKAAWRRLWKGKDQSWKNDILKEWAKHDQKMSQFQDSPFPQSCQRYGAASGGANSAFTASALALQEHNSRGMALFGDYRHFCACKAGPLCKELPTLGLTKTMSISVRYTAFVIGGCVGFDFANFLIFDRPGPIVLLIGKPLMFIVRLAICYIPLIPLSSFYGLFSILNACLFGFLFLGATMLFERITESK